MDKELRCFFQKKTRLEKRVGLYMIKREPAASLPPAHPLPGMRLKLALTAPFCLHFGPTWPPRRRNGPFRRQTPQATTACLIHHYPCTQHPAPPPDRPSARSLRSNPTCPHPGNSSSGNRYTASTDASASPPLQRSRASGSDRA